MPQTENSLDPMPEVSYSAKFHGLYAFPCVHTYNKNIRTSWSSIIGLFLNQDAWTVLFSFFIVPGLGRVFNEYIYACLSSWIKLNLVDVFFLIYFINFDDLTHSPLGDLDAILKLQFSI